MKANNLLLVDHRVRIGKKNILSLLGSITFDIFIPYPLFCRRTEPPLGGQCGTNYIIWLYYKIY